MDARRKGDSLEMSNLVHDKINKSFLLESAGKIMNDKELLDVWSVC